MLNCRQIVRLVSQSLDARLPWHKRVAVRVHLLYCVWCRRYAAQVRILRKAAKELDTETAKATPPDLSPEAKEQMHRRLEEALRSSSPPS